MAGETKTMTRGAELLAKVSASSREIATALGVSPGLVGGWKTGTRRPTKKDQARIEERWPKVPAASWSESAKKARAGGAPRRVELEPAPVPTTSAEVTAPVPMPIERNDQDDDLEGNNARLRRYIREGIRDLEHDTELSGVKRAEALKKLVDAQVALDRSTGENALTLARIVAHPEFQRVVKLITEAITPFPEALRAAISALESTGA